MRAATVEISSKSVRNSAFRLNTKNAWAKHVRNRWPVNTLAMIQREWDLTEGQARGVLYAQASQSTIDEIMDTEDRKRPLGAFRLGLIILEIRTATTLADYIEQQAQGARRERIEWEREEHRLALLQSRVSGRDSLDGGSDQPPGAGGSTDARLVADPHGTPVGETQRSYAPNRRRD